MPHAEVRYRRAGRATILHKGVRTAARSREYDLATISMGSEVYVCVPVILREEGMLLAVPRRCFVDQEPTAVVVGSLDGTA